MFVSSSFRGVLEAAQRFDLVNAVKVPVNVLFYLLPLAGVVLGLKLPGIVVLLVASRLAGLVLWARLSFGVLPALRTKPAFQAGLVRSLFSFSGWIGLSSILFAVTTSIDRLIIGAVITVEAVAFYSAPYEAINRVGVIPGSLGMVLFPAFSYLDAGRKGTEAESLFARSTKLLLLTTGPVFILLMFFARDFLRLWLGPDYAAAATLVVQVLAAGFFVNTVFAVPNNYLQGIGRADIAPKYQLVELVVYGALAWGGAKLWGIKGVALATAFRLVAFTLVLWVASFRAGRVRFGFVWRNGLAAVLAGLGLLALGLGASSLLGFGLWGAGALCAAFAAGAWRWLLDAEEKGLLGGLLRSGRVGGKAAQEGG
jgi:O-antigen/teichoic acid export membrane protein